MPSDISIINGALLSIGLNPIASRTEASTEARAANALYEDVLRATLRDCAPGFAKQQIALSLLDETRSGWAYTYAWPSGCIEARGIFNPATDGTIYDEEDNPTAYEGDIPMEIGLDSTGKKKVILTNQAEAELIYTAYVSDANVFDPLFVSAMQLNLAAHLAIPLKRDKVLRKDMLQEYLSAKSASNAKDANETKRKRSDRSSFTRSRE